MAISDSASKFSLPQHNPGVVTVLDYLIIKFPYIDKHTWQQRMAAGKVHWHDGSLITSTTEFQPQQRVYYYREVENEAQVPFQETIVFQDEHLLVAYKPHFLAVTPGGQFVNECLQTRLRQRTGLTNLQALHRLDRVTAGLVIFSINPATRHSYHQLFKTRQIQKTYQAIANIRPNEKPVGQEWTVKNRLEAGEPSFRMQVSAGEANSHSVIRCVQQNTQQALFELMPITGRTHQLRVHMQTLGWPILNDRYYPHLQALSEDNYTQPLQLLAKEMCFIDPITQQLRHFCYQGQLALA
ncbi:pseudouridine synthase [Marinomonas pollencensis]|uniref:tRNA pseudouridine32 synthase/23S rRNA pseudouridine746 synthase n=1 Tax=Marinomonas pollencensis TaxID=491954 RepID=A0A3E0DNH2_9GAMM|nr:pseudouridine synthase [Marinomonas pollencensis]REG84299.1 tRNA pseudouridine32 synthase/23S rRNA pseudouridine746 synthase [Marinomonas pollencensis]